MLKIENYLIQEQLYTFLLEPNCINVDIHLYLDTCLSPDDTT